MTRQSLRPVAALLPLALLVAACRPAADSGYRAEIRRTSYNIAHIKADDLASLGFGEGYALAQDHLCTVADQVVRARGERAKYFGAGESGEHLRSDVGFRALEMHSRAASELSEQSAEIQEWIAGYVAGYNKYLRETGRQNVAGWCRGADWVFEITAADLQAPFRSVIHISTHFVDMIAAAAPPRAASEATLGSASAALSDDPLRQLLELGSEPGLAGWDDGEMKGASNGWGLGRDRSEKGRGMLIANPHYPWEGSNRFWEKHLTIPGELDVYGVGLLGAPGVAIGFNEAVAWTHTVSAGERFTLYKLDLVDGDPTSYLYDGEARAMTSKDLVIEVLMADGSMGEIEKTVYFSHYGPVIDFPGFGWTERFAVAMRDTNEANDEAAAQWLEMDRAQSMDEFQEVHARWNAMPWVNTISTSAEGRAWYADGSSTPRLSDEALELWRERRQSEPLARAAWERGIVLLDGSDSRFEWTTDPEARDPGVVAFEDVPQIERTDYVFNANDSYWLANPAALLTGYSPMHGLEGSALTLRTRMNAVSLSDLSPGGPAGEDGRFSLDEMAAEILSNRSLAAELLLDALVDRCSGVESVEVDGEVVRIAEACEALGGFDGRLEIASRGAVLFREWITRFPRADLFDVGSLFAVPFDPADPVGTPRGLAEGPHVLRNLAKAVQVLERAGHTVDIALGEVQSAHRGGRKIPMHGGDGTWEGVENFIRYRPNQTTLEPAPRYEPVEGSRRLSKAGYPVNFGSSFLMALEYTDEGPNARAFLTYSQSGDPESPHFYDQTELFSAKAWRPILFEEEAVAADTRSTMIVTGD